MLNILPPIRKITLRRAFIAKDLRLLTGIAIMATSLAVIMVFVSDWILQRWLDDAGVSAKTDIISAEERTELKELVSNLVLEVNQIQPLISKHHQPLTDLAAILQPTPTSIQLHSFSLSYSNHELALAGTAATRDDLVVYQQVVNAIPGMRNVKLPLNDLSQKEAITFNLTATYETPSPETTQ